MRVCGQAGGREGERDEHESQSHTHTHTEQPHQCTHSLTPSTCATLPCNRVELMHVSPLPSRMWLPSPGKRIDLSQLRKTRTRTKTNKKGATQWGRETLQTLTLSISLYHTRPQLWLQPLSPLPSSSLCAWFFLGPSSFLEFGLAANALFSHINRSLFYCLYPY